MIDSILRLGKEAAIYGLSSIVGRFLNFLLVPLYTNLLAPAEYGVIANLYAYTAFVAVLFGYGMDAAYMRFVSSLSIGDKKQNFSVPLISLAGTSLLFAILIHWNAPAISDLIAIGENQAVLVRMAAWILFFDTLVLVPYADLRMENRAGTFAAIRIANIVLTVVFNVAFLTVGEMKAEGVVLANLLASALTFGIHLRWIVVNFTPVLPAGLYPELLKFGLPYVPAGLASIAMQVIDRPILQYLTDTATVGIYQANYRMGVFMMLVVGMFDYAWRPFFLKHADKPDAPQLFSRVFSFFCIISVTLFLVLTLFIEDLIRVNIGSAYFIHPAYWGGVSIIPVILLAYIFNGAYVNFLVGVYLKKKTSVLPMVFGVGALVNVASNFLLIPRFGLMGAAWATLLSYAVLAVGIFFPSQRLYPIPYDWKRIIRLGAVTVIVVSIFLLLPQEPASAPGILFKTGLVAAFGVLLVAAGVVRRNEFSKTKDAVEHLSDQHS